MKKLTIVFVLLAPIAGAVRAEQNNITVYGIVDAAIVHDDKGAAASATKPGGTKWSLSSGGASGSRLGFKGSEDLGNGLSAIFTLENGFNVDDGTLGQSDATRSRIFGRQAWVGLSGDFGALKLGRQNTPMRNVLSAVNPFDIGDLAGNLDKAFDDDGGGFRMDNAVNYSTPKLGGFFAEAAYGFGETANDISTSRQAGLEAGYSNGPVYAAVAYHDIKGNALTGGSHSTSFVGGVYDFGVVKFHLGYAQNKADTTTAGTTTSSHDLLVGATVPFGNSAFLASYVRHSDQHTNDADFNRVALGYDYNLSKRSTLYASWARTSNERASARFVDDAGETYSILVAGFRFKF